MRPRLRQSGNAVVFILIGVALFGALAYTFTRGARTGQGNLSATQARVAAQELAAFLTTVNKAFQKLRQNGCSENDISFAYTGTNGTMGTSGSNHPSTAPGDYSCHIFRAEGGGVTMNIDPEKYQLSYDQIAAVSPGNQGNHDNFYFRQTTAKNIGVGTDANDLMMHFNFIRPEVCKAYNTVNNLTIDYSVADTGPIVGDENTGYVGKETLCRYSNSVTYGQIRYVWSAR